MNRLITLLGALTLMASVSGRADVRADIFNRLDNDDNYNSLSSDEQAVLDGALEKAISNIEEKGVTLSDSGAQMFLIDTFTKLLGLSKGAEDTNMKKPATMPAPASNSAEGNLMLMDANGNYFLIDTIKNVVDTVVNAGKSVLGIGTKPAAAPTGSTSLLGNEMDNGINLHDNIQYGAITDALKQLGGAVAEKVSKGAEKVKDFLGGKKPAEEPMVNPEAMENTMNAGLSLEDSTAQYGAVLDALKNLGGALIDKAKDLGSKVAGAVGSVADKVGGMLKDKPVEETPAE